MYGAKCLRFQYSLFGITPMSQRRRAGEKAAKVCKVVAGTQDIKTSRVVSEPGYQLPAVCINLETQTPTPARPGCWKFM